MIIYKIRFIYHVPVYTVQTTLQVKRDTVLNSKIIWNKYKLRRLVIINSYHEAVINRLEVLSQTLGHLPKAFPMAIVSTKPNIGTMANPAPIPWKQNSIIHNTHI